MNLNVAQLLHNLQCDFYLTIRNVAQFFIFSIEGLTKKKERSTAPSKKIGIIDERQRRYSVVQQLKLE